MADLEVPERLEVEWRTTLSSFKEQLYPVFEEHGIDFGMALLLFKIDNLGAEIYNLIDVLEDRE